MKNKRNIVLVYLFAFLGIMVIYFAVSYFRSINEMKKDGLQPFVVESMNQKNNQVLVVNSINGNERVELYDSKFLDGTKIFETRLMVRKGLSWEQVLMTQSGYKESDLVRQSQCGFYVILEVIDPNVNAFEYETKASRKLLPIYGVDSRRFVIFYKRISAHEYNQIYAKDKSGNVIWKEYPDSYWGNN